MKMAFLEMWREGGAFQDLFPSVPMDFDDRPLFISNSIDGAIKFESDTVNGKAKFIIAVANHIYTFAFCRDSIVGNT